MAEKSVDQIRREIRASLRIFSDEYDLSTVVPLLGISPDDIRRKGERLLVRGTYPYAPFHRNGASSGDDFLPDLDAINPWLSCRLRCIEQAPSVPALLQSGMIEATLWIFISDYPPGAIPAVDPAIRQRAAKLNVSIYFEHYFEGEPDAETGPWPTRLMIKHNTDDLIT
jgi:hypothetical protein